MVWFLGWCLLACARGGAPEQGVTPPVEDRTASARAAMVRDQLAASDGRAPIRAAAVLRAMGEVPRHRFVPPAVVDQAYADRPLPIGFGQTISQPWVVARMTELLDVSPGERVLEVGTGSGYQAAVLAAMGCEVWTIEIVAPLAARAADTLADLGYDRVRVRAGDGYRGWPEHAPFDAIVVTAAPDHVPQPLVDQLAVGAHLVLPVGPADGVQELVVLTRRADGGVDRRAVSLVRFVPLTGEGAR